MKKINFTDRIILSIFILLVAAEAVNIVSLFFRMTFEECSLVMLIILLVTIIILIISRIGVGCFQRKKTKVDKAQGCNLPIILKNYQGLAVIIGAIVLFQIIWNYILHLPDSSGDITVETVQTFLATDQLYQINPMTGAQFSVGMPLRLQILLLPTFYACLSYWTAIPPMILIYQIIPMIVLFLSYLVYTRWAVYLFPNNRNRQVLFALFVALVYQFGCYASVMDSYKIFFMGWQGDTIRATIILPYALLSSLQGKWVRVILCALVEVSLVWTTYGIGYTVVMAAIILVMKGIKRFIEKRRALK